MTREEAIKNIKEHCYFANLIPQAKEALDTAIKALRQKPCEDADVKLIHTQGLDEVIRCAMCTNSMKSDRGCDGGCQVDKDMYNRVMETIKKHTESEV